MDSPLIAIVSADARYREDASQALTAAGYQMLAVPPGAGDHRAIRTARPALVILVLSPLMPESGWTLFTAVRANWDTQNMPVLLCFQHAAYLRVKKPDLRRLGGVTIPADMSMPDLVAKVRSTIGPAVPATFPAWGNTWMH